MTVLRFASEDFPRIFGSLVEVWPEDGKWTKERLAKIKTLVASFQALNPRDPILIDLSISKEQLQTFGQRLATVYSTPWKYDKYFRNQPGLEKTLNAKSLKLRPGTEVGLSIEGFATTGRVNTIRRTTYSGDPNYVKSDITWSTKNIPLFLDGETKCTCKYCGTSPVGEESECRKCGAPLPSC